jgi:hypothetical protein
MHAQRQCPGLDAMDRVRRRDFIKIIPGLAAACPSSIFSDCSHVRRLDLTADLTSGVRLRVHIDVPLAGGELLSLFGS